MDEKRPLDNTDLFRFEFTDREQEQCILKNFLSDNQQHVLWIHGKSGIGKTFFVKNCIWNTDIVYVENKNSNKAGECILDLISELQHMSNSNFWEFVRSAYSNIKSMGKDIPKLSVLTESAFFQYIFSKNVYVVDKENQYNNLSAILQKYIDKNLKESSLVFVIDNFDKCDENSVDILLEFAKANINQSRRKFIFITTETDDELCSNEKRLIQEISCKNLPVNQIPNEKFFINMLPTTFDTSNLEESDMKKIYEACQGIPEKLQDLLMNLNRENAIDFSKSKMTFDTSNLKKQLFSEELVHLSIEKFTPIEQCLLLAVVCMGIPLESDLLIALAVELHKKLYGLPLPKQTFQDALQRMQPKPLMYYFESAPAKVYTDHDLTFGAALMYFKSKNMFHIACDTIYHYLSQDDTKQYLTNFSNLSQKELWANLSYNAKNFSWEALNLQCAKCFFDLENYVQATNYYNRFLNCIDLVPEEDKLYCAIANYEVGFYKYAESFLLTIKDPQITQSYNFYIWAGKIENMNKKSEQAKIYFARATESAALDSQEELYAKYMLHIVLTQLPGHWEQAREIYGSLVNKILQFYSEGDEEKIYHPNNARILKCCYNFYYNNEALDLMKKALEISEHLQMKIEKAFILNNMGFEYARQNLNGNAMDCFKAAYEILIKTKPHESAYALNNIGICQMFDGDYSGAELSFKDALLYKQSYYVELTAKTMLLQCYSIKKDEKHKALANELVEWIKQHKNEDPAIIRKISMNLVIYRMHEGMNMQAKKCMDDIKDIVVDTSSEYRARKLQRKLNGQADVEEKQVFVFAKSRYFNEMSFEPWFITLSHD